MASVYTVGIWTVTAGREEEFVAAWQAMADATHAEFPGSSARLVHDRDLPNRFVSFGPWDSDQQIHAWRQSAVFADGIARMRGLLDDFQAFTMDEVGAVG